MIHVLWTSRAARYTKFTKLYKVILTLTFWHSFSMLSGPAAMLSGQAARYTKFIDTLAFWPLFSTLSGQAARYTKFIVTLTFCPSFSMLSGQAAR
jgi:hypothetical protein